MALRRRIRIILLSPLLISFSIASWILDLIEGPADKKIELHSESNDIEVGLIEEIAEEQLSV